MTRWWPNPAVEPDVRSEVPMNDTNDTSDNTTLDKQAMGNDEQEREATAGATAVAPLGDPEREAQALRLVSAALTSIRMRSPFFATLALFARILIVETLPTAATDGRDIYVNPDFLASLTAAQRAGLLLHEVLHAALLHVPRRGSRDGLLWNIAADIVVNGVIAREQGYELPEGALRGAEIEHLSVEEVYHILLSDPERRPLIVVVRDLLDAALGPGTLGGQRRTGMEEHWRYAMEQASTIARGLGQGTAPAGMQRELGTIRQSRLDWRSHLWRFLVKTPTDFQGFDRRFIGRGLYLETLDGEDLRVYVAVDTSGSVGSKEMETFLGEVQGILGAYPHLRCQLYYADAACYGPYALSATDPLPRPIGGGGTDFRPFFAAVEREGEAHEGGVCVYLTDGAGTFPSAPPDLPVLWVLTAGGIALEAVPFGEAVRLIEER
jgi:predicted metal-dependent peptidase